MAPQLALRQALNFAQEFGKGDAAFWYFIPMQPQREALAIANTQ
jgi:hypothetical protein